MGGWVELYPKKMDFLILFNFAKPLTRVLWYLSFDFDHHLLAAQLFICLFDLVLVSLICYGIDVLIQSCCVRQTALH